MNNVCQVFIKQKQINKLIKNPVLVRAHLADRTLAGRSSLGTRRARWCGDLIVCGLHRRSLLRWFCCSLRLSLSGLLCGLRSHRLRLPAGAAAPAAFPPGRIAIAGTSAAAHACCASRARAAPVATLSAKNCAKRGLRMIYYFCLAITGIAFLLTIDCLRYAIQKNCGKQKLHLLNTKQ